MQRTNCCISVVNEPAALNLKRSAYVFVQTASSEREKGHAKGLVPPACPRHCLAVLRAVAPQQSQS